MELEIASISLALWFLPFLWSFFPAVYLLVTFPVCYLDSLRSPASFKPQLMIDLTRKHSIKYFIGQSALASLVRSSLDLVTNMYFTLSYLRMLL